MMPNNFSFSSEKFKHMLYLISMGILLCLTGIVLIQSVFDYTLLDYLKYHVDHRRLSVMFLLGAALFVCVFLLIGGALSKLSSGKQLILTAVLAAAVMLVQYALLFHLQAVVRYDHLRVFDGALEILHTGKLSLSDQNGYFGCYPFNISITVLHSAFLRLMIFFGLPEKYYLLSLQCLYLFLIDLGVFFSWQIVRMLHSVKNATLFALLCAVNPMLYVCAMGCYTTTFMIPLLMAAMLCILCFLQTTELPKKYFYAFLSGLALAFGTRIRATVLIAGIAFVIYLVVREAQEDRTGYSRKQLALFLSAAILGGALGFGGYTAYQNSYITEDYTDTQMPPIYYLMFAANPESEGRYNEDDFLMISQYETLKEKEAASAEVFMERLKAYGASGLLSLAEKKLRHTWSDGTEDYRDFLITSRNYGTVHSVIAGEHKDFFVVYAHIYHLAVMGLLCLAVILAFRRSCDSYYLIFLTLLGGMIFHIFWESYYIYSFGFSMLILIPASQSLCHCSAKRYTPHTAGSLGLLAAAGLVLVFHPVIDSMANDQYEHTDFAVMQDMVLGSCEPLTMGNCITQTFRTNRPFNRIGCKVYNDFGTDNQSIYRMELLSASETVLAQRDITGSEAENGGYCYLQLENIVPNGTEDYQIRITPLNASDEHFLVFGYYNTHYYDIYSDGCMTGLNSDERSDLAFQVFQNVTSGYFH